MVIIILQRKKSPGGKGFWGLKEQLCGNILLKPAKVVTIVRNEKAA